MLKILMWVGIVLGIIGLTYGGYVIYQRKFGKNAANNGNPPAKPTGPGVNQRNANPREVKQALDATGRPKPLYTT